MPGRQRERERDRETENEEDRARVLLAFRVVGIKVEILPALEDYLTDCGKTNLAQVEQFLEYLGGIEDQAILSCSRGRTAQLKVPKKQQQFWCLPPLEEKSD